MSGIFVHHLAHSLSNEIVISVLLFLLVVDYLSGIYGRSEFDGSGAAFDDTERSGRLLGQNNTVRTAAGLSFVDGISQRN